MATKRGFLVGRFVDGTWQVASTTGYHFGGAGACHPLVDGMTEVDHEQICQAVCWMVDEPAARVVELTADNTYCVSWR
jgi:hypothetical protein